MLLGNLLFGGVSLGDAVPSGVLLGDTVPSGVLPGDALPSDALLSGLLPGMSPSGLLFGDLLRCWFSIPLPEFDTVI